MQSNDKVDEMTLVQMRLRPQTIAMVKELQEMLQSDNRTDVLRSAVEIARLVVGKMQDGGKVIIEHDGVRETVTIPQVAAKTR